MIHKNTQSSSRWGAGGLRLRLFALLGLVLLAGLVLSQCRDDDKKAKDDDDSSRTALTGVTAITIGERHACALQGGQALCWGEGTVGQLGNGESGAGELESSPEEVVFGSAGGTALTDVEKISAGGFHTCAVVGSSTKQALCWGSGADGQLGNSGVGVVPVRSSSPVAVRDTTGNQGTMLTGVAAISAGGFHSCAMTNSQALCWGRNNYGQLGIGGRVNSNSPVAVLAVGASVGGSLLMNVTEIDAGGDHTCALVSGEARCWGRGTSGQLGNGGSSHSNSPVAVLDVGASTGGSLLTVVDKISAGDEHSCAVAGTSRQALCWGRNNYGQLGNGGTNPAENSPVAVLDVGGVSGSTLTNVEEISAGDRYTCALLTSQKQALCWGRGSSGQLGDGTKTRRLSPVAVLALGGASGSMLTGVTAFSAGHNSTCAVVGASRQALCWGKGTSGRLGNGMTEDKSSPVQVTR